MLVNRLDGIKATIVSIKPDHKIGKAGIRVNVQVKDEKTERTKDFLVKLDGNQINFMSFKAELEKSVKADLDREAEAARALAELTAVEGKPFDLFDYIPSTHTKKKRRKV